MRKSHIVILEIGISGAVYLGKEHGQNIGVGRIENATRYTERGARNLAAQYRRAVVAPVGG